MFLQFCNSHVLYTSWQFLFLFLGTVSRLSIFKVPLMYKYKILLVQWHHQNPYKCCCHLHTESSFIQWCQVVICVSIRNKLLHSNIWSTKQWSLIWEFALISSIILSYPYCQYSLKKNLLQCVKENKVYLALASGDLSWRLFPVQLLPLSSSQM